MNIHYAVQIIWSQEDGAYLARAAELAGCIADGQTPLEAFNNLEVVIAEWLEEAKEDGIQPPKPLTKADIELAGKQDQENLQRFIHENVQIAVNEVMKHFMQQQAQVTGTHFRREMFGASPEELELAGGHKHR